MQEFGETSSIVGRNSFWFSDSEKQYGTFQKKKGVGGEREKDKERK